MNEINHHQHKYVKFIGLILLGMLLALGNAGAGWFIAKGLMYIKMEDRYVSVKGLAEHKVKADLAIWDIGFKVAGNELAQANAKIASDRKGIVAFLNEHGITNDEIEIQQTSVVDQYANEYASSNKPQNRYIISCNIRVRSTKVDLLKQTSSSSSELVAQGIILDKDYSANPRYLFTQLDSIRPAMLDEATESARLVAEQFAKNSGNALGKIKRANQGVFQILSADNPGAQSTDNDEPSSIYKKIRVVTSIDYYL